MFVMLAMLLMLASGIIATISAPFPPFAATQTRTSEIMFKLKLCEIHLNVICSNKKNAESKMNRKIISL